MNCRQCFSKLADKATESIFYPREGSKKKPGSYIEKYDNLILSAQDTPVSLLAIENWKSSTIQQQQEKRNKETNSHSLVGIVSDIDNNENLKAPIGEKAGRTTSGETTLRKRTPLESNSGAQSQNDDGQVQEEEKHEKVGVQNPKEETKGDPDKRAPQKNVKGNILKSGNQNNGSSSFRRVDLPNVNSGNLLLAPEAYQSNNNLSSPSQESFGAIPYRDQRHNQGNPSFNHEEGSGISERFSSFNLKKDISISFGADHPSAVYFENHQPKSKFSLSKFSESCNSQETAKFGVKLSSSIIIGPKELPEDELDNFQGAQ